jgi:hypothetical protein
MRDRRSNRWAEAASGLGHPGGWGVLLLALTLSGATNAQGTFPPGGSDAFDSSLTVNLDVTGLGQRSVVLEGPTVVLRSDPTGDPCAIETEIVALDAHGHDAIFGDIHLRLHPAVSSVGRIVSLGKGCTFPADSFFDVFVEVEVELFPSRLVNLQPVRVTNDNLKVIPPFFDSYVHPLPAIPLVSQDNPQGPLVATIDGGSTHRVEQNPTFSVAPSGPSQLDPADLHDDGNPPPANLPAASLGLASGDDIDALSYGLDVLDDFEDPEAEGSFMVAFSVDPASVGSPNSGVNREATQTTPEAYADEFITYFQNSNIELVDEQALVLQEGSLGDDLDALTGQPTRYPDPDGNTIPERPVFFSLAPGSPSLTTLGVSPADLLFSQNGSVGVYALESDLGLVPGDDVDALCLQKSGLPSPVLRPGVGPPGPPAPGAAQFDYALFSLARGSPTLATIGASAADLLVTDFSPNRPNLVAPPALYAEAAKLGLLDSDDLDALKCLLATVFIPVDHPDGDGAIVINVGGTDSLRVPQQSYDGIYDVWSIRNAGVDRHGPYLHPSSPLADFPFLPLLDPSQVVFVGGAGDNCGFPHVHGSFESHADPDQPACGHGVFVPHLGPGIPVQQCTDVRVVVGELEQGVDDAGAAHPHLNVSASLRFMDRGVGGPTASAAADRDRGAPDPEPPGATLIVVGAGRTNIELDVLGGIGPDVGAPVPALEPPLMAPEPSAALAGLAALAALGVLARRAPRVASSPRR